MLTFVHHTKRLLVVYLVRYNQQATYVGLAPLREFPDLADARRNTEWQRMMRPADSIELDIIGLFNTDEEAAHAQRVAIETYKPHCNLYGAQEAPTAGGAGKTVLEPATGLTWPSVKALAIELGVSGQAVTNHLEGRSKTVGGRQFVRP